MPKTWRIIDDRNGEHQEVSVWPLLDQKYLRLTIKSEFVTSVDLYLSSENAAELFLEIALECEKLRENNEKEY